MKIIFLSALLFFAMKGTTQVAKQAEEKTDTSKAQTITIDDKTFLKVEIESEYPGGLPAWAKFLNANIHYPDKAIRKRIQGEVVVQFIVDKEGSVSDVQAISGPDKGGLREEAVRVIKISGKWTAAVQFGRKVKSYKKQPIIFRLD
jgi:protein TonB